MKTVIAKFTNDNYANVYDVYQWDYGQVLRIEGLKLPNMVEIHFSLQETSGEAKTRIGVTKDGVTDVVIPDSFLENEGIGDNYKIFAWVYVADRDSGSTEYKITIHVKARAKPEITHGGQDGEVFQEAVEAVRDAAKRAAESEKQAEGWAHGREDLPERAEDNAMYYAGKASEDAKKTAQDRAEVERLTESNTQIQGEVAKDLEEVKKFSSQAQTSATNAALSEQKSEEAATRAETAQAGAETAEDNAELAAQKAGQDKTAVEQARDLVQQMGQEVLDNKNAVDETAQDFNLTAQQALADVNNAGQAQTERVQTAGTTAVENIENAQGTATQAVETAKSEAIKAVQTEGTTQTGNVTAEGEKQVQAVQTAAQEIVADREQIQKNKTDIADLRQNKADAIVETESGTLLNVKDSAEAFVENLVVHGKTEQVQTAGKNLLDIDTAVSKGWNLDITNLSHLIAGEKYTMSVVSLNDSACGIVLDDAEMLLTYLGPGRNASFTMPDKSTFSKMSLAGSTATALVKDRSKVKIQIEKGSVATNYEPYTGGKPSPSPEYPQPVVSAGRLNEDTGKYEIDIKVTGKNLIPFPYTAISGNKGTKNGITWEVLTDGGIMLNGTANPETFYLDLHDNLKIGNTLIPPGGTDGRIATNKDVSYDGKISKAYIAVNKGVTVNRVYYPQVEIGTVATAYEPYREPQTITLALDRPLTKWDRLEKREGVWGIVRQGETKVLKAALEEEWAAWEDKQNAFFIMNDKIIKEGLCSHFEAKGNFEIGKETGIYLSETIHLIVTDMNINSLENWKTWLQANPITVTYKTAEEIWEPLPEETQKALNELHTNYPTTIVANSEDIHMELSYTADTKNYTDRKIEEAVSAQVQNLANLLSLMPLSTQAAMIEADTNNILDMEVQNEQYSNCKTYDKFNRKEIL